MFFFFLNKLKDIKTFYSFCNRSLYFTFRSYCISER